jgi:hypothetical protein
MVNEEEIQPSAAPPAHVPSFPESNTEICGWSWSRGEISRPEINY